MGYNCRQTIIKWGRTDFPIRLQNSILRIILTSPDPEDMDMGNLLVNAKIYPIPAISLEAVAVPYYRLLFF